MSTLKEIEESKVTIILKPKESLLLSVARDSITFGFLLLCWYVSSGSRFWTFVTGVLFLVFLWNKFIGFLKERVHTFSSRKEAVDFINKQENINE